MGPLKLVPSPVSVAVAAVTTSAAATLRPGPVGRSVRGPAAKPAIAVQGCRAGGSRYSCSAADASRRSLEEVARACTAVTPTVSAQHVLLLCAEYACTVATRNVTFV